MSKKIKTPLTTHPALAQKPLSSWTRVGLLIVLLSLAFAGPMLWFHHDSLRNLISFHGTLHVAIANQISHGELAPENPFYAGEPVGYYWFFHYASYHLASALHTDVLHAIELLSLIAIVGLAAIAVALGRKLWGSAFAGACIGFLVLVGANGLGWLILVAKIIRDGPYIMSAPASAVVLPLLMQVQFGDHRFGPNFTYYFHMTSRPISLTLALAMVACVYWLIHKRSLVVGFLLAIATTLCVAVNPLIGLAASGALIGGLMINRVIQQYVTTPNLLDHDAADTTLLSCGAMILGSGCAWPTFSHLFTVGNGAGIHFDPFRLKLYGIILANISVLVPFVWMGYRRLDARSVGFGRSVIIGGVLLLVGTLLFAMPGTLSETGRTGNEHNLFNTAIVLLAVPASGAVMRLRSSDKSDNRSPLVTWRAVALILIFLPTTVLIMLSYRGRAPVRVTLDRNGMTWQDKTLPMAQFYSWVSANTAPDAVFVVSPDQAPKRLCNVSDFPAFTQRCLFTDQSSYMTDVYADAQYRADLSTNMASGLAMTAEDRAYLKRLARPIYVTSYNAHDTKLIAELRRAYGEPLFIVENIAVFQFAP